MPKFKGPLLGSTDTETTGLDLDHGAKPFLVTIYNEQTQENIWWEWDVDPLTRQPNQKQYEEDQKEIEDTYSKFDGLVLHNPKFDIRALQTIYTNLKWDWSKTYDVLTAAHLECSDQQKDLTTLTLVYLHRNVKPFEDNIKEACNKARRIARSKYPEWRIAKRSLPEMPSAKETVWKNDMWLPRCIAQEENYPDDHPWWTICSRYANADSATTLGVYRVLEELIKERDLWAIYQERLKLLPILYEMEREGISLSESRQEELFNDYQKEFDEASEFILGLAEEKGFKDLKLPKGASPTDSLVKFTFEGLNLPVIKKSQKTGEPSLAADVKRELLLRTEHGSVEEKFLETLTLRSKRGTSLSYMESYEAFRIRKNGISRLHSWLNPTGTNTLRMSSQNPNQQQISKQYFQDDRNLRYIFGPPKGKVWVAIDYDNLELRIPAYECQEPAMLELFEAPDKAPFYGSYHLLIVSILHEELWYQCMEDVGPTKAGELFKKKYKDTYYQWTKNGNFAELYGAVDTGDGKGTADRAFHMPGAQEIIAERLTAKNQLNQDYIAFAQDEGYVTTLPDLEVSPKQGYPLQCRRTRWGKVKPTIPLNYHVQGTACWIMMRAMIKVQSYFDTLDPSVGARMVMNVHDELVLEFNKKANWKPKAQKVRVLMESIGKILDPQIKLTCGIDVHPNNWSQSI